MYSILQTIGFTQNEVKVYENLTRLGTSDIQTLYSEVKIHRRNIYDAIIKLQEHGMIASILEGDKYLYYPVHPSKLVSNDQILQEGFNQEIQTLTKLYNTRLHNYRVTQFYGLDGWRYFMNHITEQDQEVYCFGVKGMWFGNKELLHFTKKFANQIVKNKIKIHILFNPKIEKTIKQQNILHLKPLHRTLNAQTAGAFVIYGHNLVLISKIEYSEQNNKDSLIVIENSNIAQLYRAQFEKHWKISK